MPDRLPQPDAPPDLLPPILAQPPFARRLTPALLADLPQPTGTTLCWLPGERARWLGESLAYPVHEDRWLRLAAELHLDDPERLRAYRRETFEADTLEVYRRAGFSETYWEMPHLLRWLVARYEATAFPLAMDYARAFPQGRGHLVLPFHDATVAAKIADWHARDVYTVAEVVDEWLRRHSGFAAESLAHTALSEGGTAWSQACRALLKLAGIDRGAVVRAAAGYGAQASGVIGALLDADPLVATPPKRPDPLPDWIDLAVLPPILLAGQHHRLPATAVEHLLTLLRCGQSTTAHRSITEAVQACDPASLAALGRHLMVLWLGNGANSHDAWIVWSLRWLADDDTANRLADAIGRWSNRDVWRLNRCLHTLASIGTPVALAHLAAFAERTEEESLRTLARTLGVRAAAAPQQLSAEQVADRVVPTHGLDRDACRVLDFGPRQFTVAFDDRLSPYVCDDSGKRRSGLPKPGKGDDAERAAAAVAAFTKLKKDVRKTAAAQVDRLERLMVDQRRWPGAELRDTLLEHPLLVRMLRRLVLGVYHPEGALQHTIRVAEDLTFADVDDKTVTLADTALLGIAHPATFTDEVPLWREVFGDYELSQPFEQLDRAVYALDPTERAAIELDRFVGNEMASQFNVVHNAALHRRGWAFGEWPGRLAWAHRHIPDGRYVLTALEDVGDPAERTRYRVTKLWIAHHPDERYSQTRTEPPAHRHERIPFGTLSPADISEIIRDLTDCTTPPGTP